LPALRDFEGSFFTEWPFCFYGLPSLAATLRARRYATLKIAPGNFLWPAILGSHPAGRRYATLKIAPGNFFHPLKTFFLPPD
jgi:hypothetical protein